MQSPVPDLEWAFLLERQIILEVLRDSEQQQELEVLRDRLAHREVRNVRPAFPDPCEIAAMAVARARVAPASILLESVSAQLAMELDRWIQRLGQFGKASVCAELESITHPDSIFREPDGTPIASDTQTQYWGMWFPGLSNDHLPLQSVLDTLPGVSEATLPDAVCELESPDSPKALPGAVSLAWHDVLHVLLGRGLLDQDEAFVIGFTMGNASRYRDTDGDRMKDAFSEQYPEPFRVYGQKLMAFELGVEIGRVSSIRDIADRDGQHSNRLSLGELRSLFGLSSDRLRAVYTREHAMIPGTMESGRLPRSYR